MTLRPLPYHDEVARILERENPKAFAALLPRRTEQADTAQLDQHLLRTTYRFEPAAHPEVHLPVARAAEALGVTQPVEVYAAEGGGPTNAELFYVPDRVVLVLTGNVTTLLDDDELCAVAGHELAHHVLWSLDGGRLLAAQRLLDAADVDARTPSEYLETARRFRLATELFADRGAYLAGRSLAASVGALIKIATGLPRVDTEAYLRQAWEVDLSSPSAGTTHPETVLRAWALQQWLERGDDAEPVVARALAAQLDLASLDLPGQDRLAVLTRGLVATLLSQGELTGDEVARLAVRYGVGGLADAPTPSASGPLEAENLSAEHLSAEHLSAEHLSAEHLSAEHVSVETRRYLAAVVLDFATADPDASGPTLKYVLDVGRGLGLAAELDKLVAAELPGVKA